MMINGLFLIILNIIIIVFIALYIIYSNNRNTYCIFNESINNSNLKQIADNHNIIKSEIPYFDEELINGTSHRISGNWVDRWLGR